MLKKRNLIIRFESHPNCFFWNWGGVRGTCHEALVDGEDEEFVGPQESFDTY